MNHEEEVSQNAPSETAKSELEAGQEDGQAIARITAGESDKADPTTVKPTATPEKPDDRASNGTTDFVLAMDASTETSADKPAEENESNSIADVDAGDKTSAADTTVDTQKPTRSVMSFLWPAYLCLFIDSLGLGVAIPILPYLALEMSWTDDGVCPSVCPAPIVAGEVDQCGLIEGCGTSIDVGALIGIFALGMMIGNAIMGRVSDRVGRKPVVMFSLFASSLGYVACGLAPTLGFLFAGRIFSGLAGGTLPVVQAMIMDIVEPRERPKYFGFAGAMLGLSFMVGPGLGAGVAALLNKRMALLSPAVIAVVVLALSAFVMVETKKEGGCCGPRHPDLDALHPSHPSQQHAHGPAAEKGGKQDMSVVYVCALCMFLAAFTFSCMTSMLALVWMANFNFGSTELGLFLMGAGVLGLIYNIWLVKFLVSRVGAPRSLLVGSALLAVGMGAFTFIDSSPILHMLFFLATIKTYDFQMPFLITIVGSAVAPHMRGKATGIVASAMSLGLGLCPFLAGPLFASDVLRLQHPFGSYSHLIFLIGGGFGLLEFLVLFAFFEIKRKGQHGPSSPRAKQSTLDESSVALMTSSKVLVGSGKAVPDTTLLIQDT